MGHEDSIAAKADTMMFAYLVEDGTDGTFNCKFKWRWSLSDSELGVVARFLMKASVDMFEGGNTSQVLKRKKGFQFTRHHKIYATVNGVQLCVNVAAKKQTKNVAAPLDGGQVYLQLLSVSPALVPVLQAD